MMSLLAMFFGDRFCFSRKGRTGGGGWVHLKGAVSMAVSGLSFRTPRLALGGPLLSSYICMNGLGKQSSCISSREGSW